MGKKEALERQKKAKEGFILLSLLSKGAVQLADWTKLAEHDDIVDWDNIHNDVDDLENTLKVMNKDPFINYFYSWLSKGNGKGVRSLEQVMAQRAAQYFLAKCVQHYQTFGRPQLTSGGVNKNARNQFIQSVRAELDGTIYDYVTGIWAGGGADDNLKKFLATSTISRKLRNGDEKWKLLIEKMWEKDGEINGLCYFTPEGNDAPEENNWNVSKYDNRIRVILMYHHALCGFHAELDFESETKGWDVEHIIPKQTWNSNFKSATKDKRMEGNRCHHIANLTLLGSSTNRSKSDLTPDKINTNGDSHAKDGFKQMMKLLNLTKDQLEQVDGWEALETKLMPLRKDFFIKSFSDERRFTIINNEFWSFDDESGNTEFDEKGRIPKFQC